MSHNICSVSDYPYSTNRCQVWSESSQQIYVVFRIKEGKLQQEGDGGAFDTFCFGFGDKTHKGNGVNNAYVISAMNFYPRNFLNGNDPILFVQ